MKKDQRAVISDYVSKLPDDELRFLTVRLIERVAGDLCEAVNRLSKKPEIDNLLGSASSAWELYDQADNIRDVVVKEAKRRKLDLYPEKNH